MSSMQLTPFTKYALTKEEELNGQVLSYSQQQVLQNQLATIAEEKLALKYDPNNHQQFLQHEAELQGQIGFIQYLFETSDRAVQALKPQ